MRFTAEQIANAVGGTVDGNPAELVDGFAKIEEGRHGAISFLANPKYSHYIYTTKSSVVLVNDGFHPEHQVAATLVRVPDAYAAVAKLMQAYAAAQPRKSGVSAKASVSQGAIIGEGVYVGDFAYIGDGVTVGDGTAIYPGAVVCDGVSIGSACTIYPNVTIYQGCKIGNGAVLHAGCVIGCDGFGFAPTGDGYDKIPQLGIVTIGDNVEIGANTCVDRSTMGSTKVGNGVKLDNLVQIAHNTDIGDHTVMSAQTGVAGSTVVGKWCMFGGQVGIGGHITIGDNVSLGAQSGVPCSLEGGQQLIGTPPIGKMAFFRQHALSAKLPEMLARISSLEKELERISKERNQ